MPVLSRPRRALRRAACALAAAATLAAACSPSDTQVRRAIVRDPAILHAAMARDPEGFMRAFEQTAQRARARAERRELAADSARRAAEFARPLRPTVEAARVVAGAADAPITIVEYTDFGCPFCRRGASTVAELLARHPGTLRVIVKHTPNAELHPLAPLAARWFEAIALQDPARAWAFKTRLFERQDAVGVLGEPVLAEEARRAGADLARLARDLRGPEVARRLAADSAEAARFGLSGTPVYLIDGVSIRGAYPLAEFEAVLARHRAARTPAARTLAAGR